MYGARSGAGADTQTGAEQGREAITGPLRWVKVFGTISAVILVTFMVVRFTMFAGM